MPIYEYRCSGCGNEFEKLVRSSDTPECPSCHSDKLEKKLSVFAAAVQGSGSSSMPEACGNCSHPGGPGCGMMQHHH